MHERPLRRGDRFELNGELWRVQYVNVSRAHCVATDRREVTIGARVFRATVTRTLDISPNSIVEIRR